MENATEMSSTRWDADVIALQELTPQNLAGIRAAGLLDAYPHRVLDPLPMTKGGVQV